MKAYVIALIDVDDPEKYQPYAQRVPETIASYGGRYLVRNGSKQSLEGEAPAERMVVLEFPSMARANEWYESQQYQAIKPVRLSASRGKVFMVEGVADRCASSCGTTSGAAPIR